MDSTDVLPPEDYVEFYILISDVARGRSGQTYRSRSRGSNDDSTPLSGGVRTVTDGFTTLSGWQSSEMDRWLAGLLGALDDELYSPVDVRAETIGDAFGGRGLRRIGDCVPETGGRFAVCALKEEKEGTCTFGSELFRGGGTAAAMSIGASGCRAKDLADGTAPGGGWWEYIGYPYYWNNRMERLRTMIDMITRVGSGAVREDEEVGQDYSGGGPRNKV